MLGPTDLVKWKARALLGLMYAAIIGGIVLCGYGLGWHFARMKGLRELNALSERHLTALNAKDAELRQREVDHAKEVGEIRVQLERDTARERAADAAVIARLRSGSERLQLAVSSCSRAPGVPADPASVGADGAGRAELAPETAAALFRIVADGDDAIRKFGKLQEWARTAVKRCGPPEQDGQP